LVPVESNLAAGQALLEAVERVRVDTGVAVDEGVVELVRDRAGLHLDLRGPLVDQVRAGELQEPVHVGVATEDDQTLSRGRDGAGRLRVGGVDGAELGAGQRRLREVLVRRALDVLERQAVEDERVGDEDLADAGRELLAAGGVGLSKSQCHSGVFLSGLTRYRGCVSASRRREAAMPAAIRDRGEPSVGGAGWTGAEVGVAELRAGAAAARAPGARRRRRCPCRRARPSSPTYLARFRSSSTPRRRSRVALGGLGDELRRGQPLPELGDGGGAPAGLGLGECLLGLGHLRLPQLLELLLNSLGLLLGFLACGALRFQGALAGVAEVVVAGRRGRPVVSAAWSAGGVVLYCCPAGGCRQPSRRDSLLLAPASRQGT
jgi:hypothetical protein